MRRSLALLALAACHRGEPDRGKFDELILDSPPGVSDLALDERGTLWAIPERDHVVLEIALPSGQVTRHPLDGVPDGVDTESLAWLAPGKLALGTEGQDVATASVLVAEARGDRFAVVHERPLTNAELGVTLEANRGAEGLCGNAQTQLVAIETVGKLPDGARYAPIARLHGDGFAGTARLRLTSPTGKISALTCTIGPDGTADVYAIERHYGVHRILHFVLPESASDATPTIVVDLDPIFHGKFNMEGLARLPDGRFALVNDNQGKTVDGPSALFLLH